MTASTAIKGAAIAAAVASMFSACATTQAGKSDAMGAGTVKCAGLNSCKGQGSCSGAHNSCKGQNNCKGQGWSPTSSEKDCADKGGNVIASAT
jgi:uncharacterized membrane protein